jgi:hypothetical protein
LINELSPVRFNVPKIGIFIDVDLLLEEHLEIDGNTEIDGSAV